MGESKWYLLFIKKNLIVHVDSSDTFINFGKIVHVIIDKKSSDVCFLYKKMEIRNLNDHLCAYECQESNNWGFTKQVDLLDFVPYTEHLKSDGKFYVPSRI